MTDSVYAAYKRCLETYYADPEFRRQMDFSPEDAVNGLGFKELLNAALARDAIGWTAFRRGGASLKDNPYLSLANKREEAVAGYVLGEHTQGAYQTDALFRYEARVRTRCQTENAAVRAHKYIYYYPFAFELSDGCSVQCPFCGFSAERHKGDFAYTPENARLFRDVVQIARAYAGRILGACPLYFATEPLDNPDYERFLSDYAGITGGVPQTTTAILERDPGRVRALMNRIGSEALNERAALRASVRTLSQFRRIAETFSPEELEGVEILANNPESVNRYSDSGRAKADSRADGKRYRYSICCVAGMKVNFVKKTVEFIEPEIPDADFPLGYRVLGKAEFEDAISFKRVMTALGDRFFRPCLPWDAPIYLNRNIRLLSEDNRFVFLGDGTAYQWGRNPFTERLISGFQSGETFSGMTSSMSVDGESKQKLYRAADGLFARGYIRDYDFHTERRYIP